ncbi:MAG TPA: NAD(P)H-hydrate dehydratase [Candidatus Acidoferrum sp.]|nr:NAD(P)H-hydrate dehydratase [Candidatus Acidoferrum sp.]
MQSLKGLSKGLLTTDSDIRRAVEPISQHSSKKSHGSVLIVGGSEEYFDAPLLAAYAANNATAALRTWSGYVTIIAPRNAAQIARGLSISLIVKDSKGPHITSKDLALVERTLHDTLVIGPGFTDSNESAEAALKIVANETKAGKTILVDATALPAFSKRRTLLGSNTIITPHYGEFKKLTGIDLKDARLSARISAATSFASECGCTLVLKGHETIITNGSSLKINISKTPALATMGTGDVLSGIIASYAALHKNPFESAVAGVRTHSLIGDLLFKRKGMHIIAKDVIDAIPDVLKRFDVIKG